MDRLSIKVTDKVFEQIVSGKRNYVSREVRPQNAEMYIELDDEGYYVEEEDTFKARTYQEIEFLSKDGSRSYIVNPKRQCIEVVFDSNGDLIVYNFEGNEFITCKYLIEW